MASISSLSFTLRAFVVMNPSKYFDSSPNKTGQSPYGDKAWQFSPVQNSTVGSSYFPCLELKAIPWITSCAIVSFVRVFHLVALVLSKSW